MRRQALRTPYTSNITTYNAGLAAARLEPSACMATVFDCPSLASTRSACRPFGRLSTPKQWAEDSLVLPPPPSSSSHSPTSRALHIWRARRERAGFAVEGEIRRWSWRWLGPSAVLVPAHRSRQRSSPSPHLRPYEEAFRDHVQRHKLRAYSTSYPAKYSTAGAMDAMLAPC